MKNMHYLEVTYVVAKYKNYGRLLVAKIGSNDITKNNLIQTQIINMHSISSQVEDTNVPNAYTHINSFP